MPAMKEFRVCGAVHGTKYIGVFRGKDKQEAIDAAIKGGETSVCLCHQCDSEVEDAEIHEFIAEEKT